MHSVQPRAPCIVPGKLLRKVLLPIVDDHIGSQLAYQIDAVSAGCRSHRRPGSFCKLDRNTSAAAGTG
jgi:hypothetical protein